jgi:hypothetical protein
MGHDLHITRRDQADYCLPIRKSSTVFVNFAVWEDCSHNIYILRVAKFHCSNSFIIASFVQTLVPNSQCENIFPSPLLHWNFLLKLSCRAYRTDRTHALVPRKSYPLCHHIYSQLKHEHSEQCHTNGLSYDILSLTNSTLQTDCMVSLCMIKPAPKWWSAFPFT